MVEILRYEATEKGKIIGFVDIKVPINKPTILIFRKITHIQSDKGRWFNPPNFPRERSDGIPDYIRYFEFEDPSLTTQLMKSLHEKVEIFCKNNGAISMGALSPQMIEMEELPF